MNIIRPAKGAWLIPCGMYVSTDSLKAAWDGLFKEVGRCLADETVNGLTNSSANANKLIVRHETEQEIYHHPDLLMGHTCGYPLVTQLHHTHVPLCVPVFDVSGCEGIHYRSWFITHCDHPGRNLEEFRNGIVTINGHDSNSGMNVLRHPISALAGGQPFFKECIISGSHGNSIRLVQQRSADLAAIDAVTFDQLKQAGAFDPETIRIIGQSTATAGLPFVVKTQDHQDMPLPFNHQQLIHALNQGLANLSQQHRNHLRIDRFEAVNRSHYDSIEQLRLEACQAGYAILQ